MIVFIVEFSPFLYFSACRKPNCGLYVFVDVLICKLYTFHGELKLFAFFVIKLFLLLFILFFSNV
jgi:hypothetical protein